jgi:ribosomal protein S18 acetylase RimI-like enzyme
MNEQYVDENEFSDELDPPTGKRRTQIVGKQEKRPAISYQIGFRPSRLPRPLAVPSPWSEQYLLSEWKLTDFLVVAEAYDTDNPTPDPETPGDIIGYIGLRVDGPRHVAWITSGGVQLDFRRHGIGTELLKEARRWADRFRLRSIMLELQTKNYPAIEFCQKSGFFFCGYNNAYYANRDVALFFALRLDKGA